MKDGRNATNASKRQATRTNERSNLAARPRMPKRTSHHIACLRYCILHSPFRNHNIHSYHPVPSFQAKLWPATTKEREAACRQASFWRELKSLVDVLTDRWTDRIEKTRSYKEISVLAICDLNFRHVHVATLSTNNLGIQYHTLLYHSFFTTILPSIRIRVSPHKQHLKMSEEEEPSSKRNRSDEHHSEVDEEDRDQWKHKLRDWFVAAPDSSPSNDDEEEGQEMIQRLLELQSPDPAADEAFATLMENAAECFDKTLRGPTIGLGRQDDYPYSELTQSSLPYLKKFLTEIPKNMKKLVLYVHTPEILRTFPDQIGSEGSALEKIVILAQMEDYSETGPLESLSLANMLYATRNVEEVFLGGFHVLTPSGNNTNSLLRAFESKTKTIILASTVICDESPIFLHPETKLSFKKIAFNGPKLASWLSGNNALENSRLLWRQLLYASKHTLSAISIYRLECEHFLAAMCMEADDQDLDNIYQIILSDIATDLVQPMSHLARSRLGSTLNILHLWDIDDRFLPAQSAHTFALFENLKFLYISYGKNFEGRNCNPFLAEYLSLGPPALRVIDLKRVELSAASFRALFSNKTLESIKLKRCGEREFFLTCTEFSSSKLRSLEIKVYGRYNYSSQHILKLLAVLPDLRRVKIDGVESMDQLEIRSIVNAIAEHSKLCLFECETRLAPRDQIIAFNQAMRLPCLRNRFKASKKQLPPGFIPKVIVRSEMLCDVSGIFQFVKEQFPSYLGSWSARKAEVRLQATCQHWHTTPWCFPLVDSNRAIKMMQSNKGCPENW